jgi:flavodoxin
MKNIILAILVAMTSLTSWSANAEGRQQSEVAPKILVAYFSWGGNTQKMAEEIARQTGAELFRIETKEAYPTEYRACTEVALKELHENKHPEMKVIKDNLNDYDVIFVGCPVWWHTAPMVINSFFEYSGYHFEEKTIIPFVTYEATYRDETLAKIVELSPTANHLKGYGTTGDVSGVNNWLKEIGIK